MQATIGTAHTATPSKAALWVGRVISGLAVAFLVFDGVGKVMNIQPVIDSSIQLGLPISLAPSLGILLLVFPVIMGALVWGGLFLRDGLLRALVLRR